MEEITLLFYIGAEMTEVEKRPSIIVCSRYFIPDRYKRWDDNAVLLVDGGYLPNDLEEPFAVPTDISLDDLSELGYEVAPDNPYTPFFNGVKSAKRILIQKVKTEVC